MHQSGYGDASAQALMILDTVRTSAYADAIEQEVKKTDVVLDIGAGSGLLSLLAAIHGARKVYAVERTGMVEIIRALALENGVADRIEIVRADLTDLQPSAFEHAPTLIVSEMLGHFAPDEDQHRLYQRGLRLAPNARMLPRSYRISFALASPIDWNARQERLLDVYGVTMRALRELLMNQVSIEELIPEDLLGPESMTDPIGVADPLPRTFSATCTAARDGVISAIAASFEATLTDGVILATHASVPLTHWQQVIFPIYPTLACRAGDEVEIEVTPRVVTRANTYAWRVKMGRERRSGDSLRAVPGDQDDFLGQLGYRKKPSGQVKATPELLAWAAVLGGRVQGDVRSMTDRLMRAMPDTFSDETDARQEVLRLLDATRALV